MKLPVVSGKRVLAALLRAGFRETHARGSHHYLRRVESTQLVCVPIHGNKDLPSGTLRSILKQAELTAEQLIEIL
ncbi:MAG: type II toxin-antitoxin system HicA family toxin [Clostridia bacterium]|nr:type II toxin-antitoxin system HicA family toxin [Deltaproteobacteria bacterium]